MTEEDKCTKRYCPAEVHAVPPEGPVETWPKSKDEALNCVMACLYMGKVCRDACLPP